MIHYLDKSQSPAQPLCGKNSLSMKTTNDIKKVECEICKKSYFTGKIKKLELNPFELICQSCGHYYEGCYNNVTCKNCGETKEIRWILKPAFINHKDFKNGKAEFVTVENMKLRFLIEVKFDKEVMKKDES